MLTTFLIEGGYTSILGWHLLALAALSAWSLLRCVRGLERASLATLLGLVLFGILTAGRMEASPAVYYDEFSGPSPRTWPPARAEPLLLWLPRSKRMAISSPHPRVDSASWPWVRPPPNRPLWASSWEQFCHAGAAFTTSWRQAAILVARSGGPALALPLFLRAVLSVPGRRTALVLPGPVLAPWRPGRHVRTRLGPVHCAG